MLKASPIIAAVKDMGGLKKCLASECRVVFVLFGDLVGISDIVDRIKSSGKIAMVHVDLIEGLSAKEVAIDFIAKKTDADGIITTKPNLLRQAKKRRPFDDTTVFCAGFHFFF